MPASGPMRTFVGDSIGCRRIICLRVDENGCRSTARVLQVYLIVLYRNALAGGRLDWVFRRCIEDRLLHDSGAVMAEVDGPIGGIRARGTRSR